MSINHRLATTVHDRTNATILDIYSLSAPIFVNYSITGYIDLFNLVWGTASVNNSVVQSTNTELYGYIFTESGLSGYQNNYQKLGLGLSNQLKRFLALPILVANPNFPVEAESIAVNPAVNYPSNAPASFYRKRDHLPYQAAFAKFEYRVLILLSTFLMQS
jgi:hypothetical protein